MVFGVYIVENCKLCLSLQSFHKVYCIIANRTKMTKIFLPSFLSFSRPRAFTNNFCMWVCVCMSWVSFGCHLIWIKYPNDLHISNMCVSAQNAVALEIGLSTKYRQAIERSSEKEKRRRWGETGKGIYNDGTFIEINCGGDITRFSHFLVTIEFQPAAQPCECSKTFNAFPYIWYVHTVHRHIVR